MKHGKNPTRNQRNRIKKHNLNPKNWLIIKDCKDGLFVQHRETKNTRVLVN